jgi:hypothetical protein
MFKKKYWHHPIAFNLILFIQLVISIFLLIIILGFDGIQNYDLLIFFLCFLIIIYGLYSIIIIYKNNFIKFIECINIKLILNITESTLNKMNIKFLKKEQIENQKGLKYEAKELYEITGSKKFYIKIYSPREDFALISFVKISKKDRLLVYKVSKEFDKELEKHMLSKLD